MTPWTAMTALLEALPDDELGRETTLVLARATIEYFADGGQCLVRVDPDDLAQALAAADRIEFALRKVRERPDLVLVIL